MADPKKWLYDLHKYTMPGGPKAAKWIIPLASFPAAYLGHKLTAKLLGGGMKNIGSSLHNMGLDRMGRGASKAGKQIQKSNPLMFAAAITALNTALSQGIYRPSTAGRDAEMKNWDTWFYPETIEKAGSLTMAAAGLEDGWQHDPFMKKEIKKYKWMVPSVNTRNLKENIWDTPGFTPGQKTFLRDSVDGATQVADNPQLLSMNDLGIGTQRAIVNNADRVPGLAEVAAKATARAAEGAFIGRGIGTLLGGTPATVNFLQNTGLVTGVLNTSDVMKKIKSYF